MATTQNRLSIDEIADNCRNQGTRKTRIYAGQQDDKNYALGCLMAMAVLFAVGLVSIGYWAYDRFESSEARPGCIVTASDIKSIHTIKPVAEKRHGTR